MSKTNIEWATDVWNPVTGCSKVSQGCKNCYAEKMHARLTAMGQSKYSEPFKHIRCHPETLSEPLKWKKHRRIFVNSMSDLFHEDVPFDFIDSVFATMACARQHDFLILTKRPQRMLQYFTERPGQMKEDFNINRENIDLSGVNTDWPLPNVWLGVSVEDQSTANERIPQLLQCPAAIRFLSCEPLLAPINLFRIPNKTDGVLFYNNVLAGISISNVLGTSRTSHFSNTIDWVIAGGESGPNARSVHPEWIVSLRDQCRIANVPFYFKQWGSWRPYATNPIDVLDGIPLRIFSKQMRCFRDGVFVNINKKESIESAFKDFIVAKVGKKAAGRSLLGAEHNNMPDKYISRINNIPKK